MRRPLVGLARLILRLFFERVEVLGEGRVPAHAPVVFALNHPSALVDPTFILALAPRPVSFLAKEPLFRMPVIGAMVRGAGCLPLYRPKDGADPAKNRATFERARALLAGGGAIALFPEGTSHDDPRLRDLKTGLARIALGAAEALAASGGPPLAIVPAGLTYSDKGRFRSQALLCYGQPIPVAAAGLDAQGEPPRDAVRALTGRVAAGLEEVTLQAERRETLDAIAWAERIYAEEGTTDLARHFDLRRRFIEGYATLRARDPGALLEIAEKVLSYEGQLAALGLGPTDLPDAPPSWPAALGGVGRALLALAAAPLAAVGALLHLPAYRLVGAAASRIAGPEVDVLATAKVFAAMAFYPATWIAAAALAGARFGLAAGLAVLAAAPLSALAALVLRERSRALRGGLVAFGLAIFRRPYYERLLAERRAIREAILALAARVPGDAAGPTQSAPAASAVSR